MGTPHRSGRSVAGALLVCLAAACGAGAQEPARETREGRIQELFLDAVEAQEAGRMEDAVRLYRHILEIDAGHNDARYNLGLALERLGAHEEALACYEEVARRDPADADAFLSIALLLDDVFGRTEQARVAYLRALDLGHPDAELIEGCLAELEAETDAARPDPERPAGDRRGGPPPEPGEEDLEAILDQLLEALDDG